MDDGRISQQIAVYKTDKKLCEFLDRLKAAPLNHYAHLHARGELMPDGTKIRSAIGIVLQDYSKGTGDSLVRVSANLAPEIFSFILSRLSSGTEQFEFTEEKIFGEPDGQGLSKVTRVSIKRASVGQDGKPRNYPWCVIVENGRGVKEQTQTGGTHMKRGSYQKDAMVFLNINDLDFFRLIHSTVRFIEAWELSYGPKNIRDAHQVMLA